MKFLKFLLLWFTVTVVMVISWSVGFLIGNGITQTSAPANNDASASFVPFLGVCVVSSLLLAGLLWSTNAYRSSLRTFSIIAYCFGMLFLLTQMETFFFSSSIGIQPGQVMSIIIAGLIMTSATVWIGILVTGKMKADQKLSFTLDRREWRSFAAPFAILVCLVYPLIYLTFGHFIAWQNENLRVYYTKSTELKPFIEQFASAFGEGIYFFQILRAAIWVIVSIPVILMLQRFKPSHYLFVALLTGLLPAIQLLIPNPYMPKDIATTHFIETSTSNFLWGLLMTYAVTRYLDARNVQPSLEKTAG